MNTLQFIVLETSKISHTLSHQLQRTCNSKMKFCCEQDPWLDWKRFIKGNWKLSNSYNKTEMVCFFYSICCLLSPEFNCQKGILWANLWKHPQPSTSPLLVGTSGHVSTTESPTHFLRFCGVAHCSGTVSWRKSPRWTWNWSTGESSSS